MDSRPFIQLKRIDGTQITSPIELLWMRAGDSLKPLSAGLRERHIASGKHFSLELVSGTRFQIGVNPSTGAVVISREALSILWACSYLNATYLEIRDSLGDLGTKVEIDPGKFPNLIAALKLFEWALKAVRVNGNPPVWPIDFPKPLEVPQRGSHETAADEIALRALGFILLHEFAHVLLEHEAGVPSEVSLQQEKDADREAIDSYFDGCSDIGSEEFLCRCYGVITALYFLSIPDLFLPAPATQGETDGRTHPPGWIRMAHVLGQLELGESHRALSFAAELKPLYLGISGRQTGGKFETPAASLEHYYDKLSGQTVVDVGESPVEVSSYERGGRSSEEI